jgi:hypothetical protein
MPATLDSVRLSFIQVLRWDVDKPGLVVILAAAR